MSGRIITHGGDNHNRDEEFAGHLGPIYSTFDSMGIDMELLRGVYAYGCDRPSQIQQRTIVPCIKGRDLIMQAKSGMGKTLIFSIAMLQRIDTKLRQCQAILIEPTRELAIQNGKVIKKLAHYMPRVKVHVAIGGTYVSDDSKAISRGTQILVATVGRLAHLIEADILDTSQLILLVVDEFDVMMTEFGLEKQLLRYIETTNYQKIFVSATTSRKAVSKSKKIMTNPMVFAIKNRELTLEGIKQYYIQVNTVQDKKNILAALIKQLKTTKSLIFCNKIDNVRPLVYAMSKLGQEVTFIHRKQSQGTRNWIMQDLRNNVIHFLITSDLLSRGIDVQQMSMVINYDMPTDKELYIHRIGRCGRYGRTGRSITFVLPNQVKKIKEIQKFYNTEVTEITDINQFIELIVTQNVD